MVYRIDVAACPDRAASGQIDPHGHAVAQQLADLGEEVGAVEFFRIFFVETDASPEEVKRICAKLLADPIVEHADVIARPPDVRGGSWVEIHLKPGVMDPVAASTEMAIRDMGLPVKQVRTGRAYRLARKLDPQRLHELAARVLANEVIESIHTQAILPDRFPETSSCSLQLRHVPLRNLGDEQLRKLSREAHLFLSLDELKAVQDYFRRLEREPTDIELETIAQTWSEHCVHKTLKSAVEVCDESGRLLRTYDNLIKETIFKATAELTARRARRAEPDFCLSVFKDNAGVIAFDDTHAVCFKVETHNHPSAIEPYGGSATGVGGVIRDVLGTGLAAKPIATTDVFCVAFPERGPQTDGGGLRTNWPTQPPVLIPPSAVPKGVIHPKRILRQIVAGVRDYGNRMGIPTVNGAVYFDERYIGNPLVFCGCVGIIPRDKIDKKTMPGDAIVVVGGRTGRDGIHGATFSSAELTDTHADEFSHAVQIGNAITEKKLADVVLQARDARLFNAITDCGAGGLSSAVGEMGAETGAVVDLEKVPLKYAGLRYDEIWISEAQERMVLAVPRGKVAKLLELARSEDVQATEIGTFGTDRSELILRYAGNEVGRLSMQFLHEGLPKSRRRALINIDGSTGRPGDPGKTKLTPPSLDRSVRASLLSALSHPNVASKHWIIRQYDHEVQAGSVIKPLIGPHQRGPSDAAVLRPNLKSFKGVAVACGLAPHISDPYQMAIASIDEAVRNAVAVGADPSRLAMLDNFCWPSVDDELTMGTLVRACEACYDAARAYRIPFISGKDSLHNQFTDTETGKVIRIPNTLLISTIGVIEDVRKCVTMDFKSPGNPVYLVCANSTELAVLANIHRVVASLIAAGCVRACHDVSDGGILVAAAEMCIASCLGLSIFDQKHRDENWMFAEQSGAYVVEIAKAKFAEANHWFSQGGVEAIALGEVVAPSRLVVSTRGDVTLDVPIDELASAWLGPLDW